MLRLLQIIALMCICLGGSQTAFTFYVIEGDPSFAASGFGQKVAAAGDFNGDGRNDILAAGLWGPRYVIFGNYSRVDVSLVTDLDGLIITGIEGDTNCAGNSLSAAGNVNGDEYADVIVGPPCCLEPTYLPGNGSAFVIFGGPDRTSISLTNLGARGFEIAGFGLICAGYYVAGIGDFNADGLDDVFVSNSGSNEIAAGWVVFGKATTTTVHLGNFLPADGILVTGLYAIVPAPAGDVNGDGVADALLCNSVFGEIVVLFGNRTAPASIDTTALGWRGYKVTALEIDCSLSGLGDVNGDGLGDFVAGATVDLDISSAQTAGYVLYGKADGATLALPFNGQGQYSWGLVLYQGTGNTMSYRVGAAGDANGDGLMDFLISLAGSRSGVSVMYGQRGTFQAPVNLSDPLDTLGFSIGYNLGFTMAFYGNTSFGDPACLLIQGTTNIALYQPNGVVYVVCGYDGASPGSIITLRTSWTVSPSPSTPGSPSPTPFTPTPSPTQSESAPGGFEIRGPLNWVAATCVDTGDFDGDGVTDFVTTLLNTLNDDLTAAVVFGNGLTGVTDIFQTAGFNIQLPSNYTSPLVASCAGDVNGDMKDDILLSVYVNPRNVFEAWVVFGKNSSDDVNIDQLGSQGFSIVGGATQCTPKARGLGDFNGDGKDDIVLQPGNLDSVYLVYGKASTSPLNLSSLNPSEGCTVALPSWSESSPPPVVASAGDVNNDHLSDLVIGDVNIGQGVAYVVFGRTAQGDIDVSNLGEQGFVIGYYGTVVGNHLNIGLAVTGVGDINGDGFGDLAVGAPYAGTDNNWVGNVYVAWGKADGATVDLSLNGTGFAIIGDSSITAPQFGWSVGGGGDVNGDHIPDVLVGTSSNIDSSVPTGLAYVVFGHNYTHPVYLAGLDQGFAVVGDQYSLLGSSEMLITKDLNGDGKDDAVFCAPGQDPTETMGVILIVFGKASTSQVSQHEIEIASPSPSHLSSSASSSETSTPSETPSTTASPTSRSPTSSPGSVPTRSPTCSPTSSLNSALHQSSTPGPSNISPTTSASSSPAPITVTASTVESKTLPGWLVALIVLLVVGFVAFLTACGVLVYRSRRHRVDEHLDEADEMLLVTMIGTRSLMGAASEAEIFWPHTGEKGEHQVDEELLRTAFAVARAEPQFRCTRLVFCLHTFHTHRHAFAAIATVVFVLVLVVCVACKALPNAPESLDDIEEWLWPVLATVEGVLGVVLLLLYVPKLAHSRLLKRVKGNKALIVAGVTVVVLLVVIVVLSFERGEAEPTAWLVKLNKWLAPLMACVEGVLAASVLVAFVRKRLSKEVDVASETLTRSRALKQRTSSRALELRDPLESEPSPSEPSVPRIPYDDLVLGAVVGRGQSAEVIRGEWHGVHIALKRFFSALGNEEPAPLLEEEAAVMVRLRHPRIVLLLGIVVDPRALGLVTHYYARGSLYNVIHPRAGKAAEIPAMATRIRMMSEIAAGMGYLHAQTPPIIHRDLKSSNVLVTDDDHVVVADFGVSRVVEGDSTMTSVGTPQWMAPEILRGGHCTERVDIYSFAIVMWELVELKVPFAGVHPLRVPQMALDGARPPLSDDAAPRVVTDLIRACWNEAPDERPSFRDCFARLSEPVSL